MADSTGIATAWFSLFSFLLVFLIIFYTFYSSRVPGFVISRLVNAAIGRHRYFKVDCVSIALLGGKVSFSRLEYSTRNTSVRVVDGSVTLRWWWNTVRQSSQDDRLPCRVAIQLNGLEYFIYNNSWKSDKIEAIQALRRKKAARQPPTSVRLGAQPSPANAEDGELKTHAEKVPRLYELFPVTQIRIKRGSVIIGNTALPTMTVLSFHHATGTHAAAPASSMLDLYKLITDLQLHRVKLRIVANPDLNMHAVASHSMRAPSKFLFGLFERLQATFPFAFGSQQTGIPLQLREPVPKQVVVPEDVATILDAGLVSLTYAFDAPGVVRAGSLADFDPHSSPQTSLSLVLMSEDATIIYGPWADRQRGIIQSHFLPFEYEPLPIYQPLPGDVRVSKEFAFTLRMNKTARIKIPFVNSQGSSEHITIETGPNTEIIYKMPWVVEAETYTMSLDVLLRDFSVSTSLFDIPLWIAPLASVRGNLVEPRVWNHVHMWNFDVTTTDAKLYLLYGHVRLFQELIRDWTGKNLVQSNSSTSLGSASSSLTRAVDPFSEFAPYGYTYSLRFIRSSIQTTINEFNIIDHPKTQNKNYLLLWRSHELKVTVEVPPTPYQTTTSSINLNISIEKLFLDVDPPATSMLRQHWMDGEINIMRILSAKMRGNYYYHTFYSPFHTDSFTFYVDLTSPTVFFSGYAFRAILAFRSNYFGAYTVPTTTAAHNARIDAMSSASANPTAAPLAPVNRFEVHISFSAPSGTFFLPPQLYSGRDALALRFSKFFLECRSTQASFDLSLLVASALLDAPLSPYESPVVNAALASDHHDRAPLSIAGFSLHMLFFYGPPPGGIGYSYRSTYHLGALSGHLTAVTFAALLNYASSFVAQFPVEKQLQARQPPETTAPYCDSLVFSIDPSSIVVWLPSGMATIQLRDGLDLSSSTLVAAHGLFRTTIAPCALELRLYRFGESALQHLQEGDASVRAGTSSKEKLRATLVGKFDTSITMSVVGRCSEWDAALTQQRRFLLAQDRVNRVCRFLYNPAHPGDDPSPYDDVEIGSDSSFEFPETETGSNTISSATLLAKLVQLDILERQSSMDTLSDTTSTTGSPRHQELPRTPNLVSQEPFELPPKSTTPEAASAAELKDSDSFYTASPPHSPLGSEALDRTTPSPDDQNDRAAKAERLVELACEAALRQALPRFHVRCPPFQTTPESRIVVGQSAEQVASWKSWHSSVLSSTTRVSFVAPAEPEDLEPTTTSTWRTFPTTSVTVLEIAETTSLSLAPPALLVVHDAIAALLLREASISATLELLHARVRDAQPATIAAGSRQFCLSAPSIEITMSCGVPELNTGAEGERPTATLAEIRLQFEGLSVFSESIGVIADKFETHRVSAELKSARLSVGPAVGADSAWNSRCLRPKDPADLPARPSVLAAYIFPLSIQWRYVWSESDSEQNLDASAEFGPAKLLLAENTADFVVHLVLGWLNPFLVFGQIFTRWRAVAEEELIVLIAETLARSKRSATPRSVAELIRQIRALPAAEHRVLAQALVRCRNSPFTEGSLRKQALTATHGHASEVLLNLVQRTKQPVSWGPSEIRCMWRGAEAKLGAKVFAAVGQLRVLASGHTIIPTDESILTRPIDSVTVTAAVDLLRLDIFESLLGYIQQILDRASQSQHLQSGVILRPGRADLYNLEAEGAPKSGIRHDLPDAVRFTFRRSMRAVASPNLSTINFDSTPAQLPQLSIPDPVELDGDEITTETVMSSRRRVYFMAAVKNLTLHLLTSSGNAALSVGLRLSNIWDSESPESLRHGNVIFVPKAQSSPAPVVEQDAQASPANEDGATSEPAPGAPVAPAHVMLLVLSNLEVFARSPQGLIVLGIESPSLEFSATMTKSDSMINLVSQISAQIACRELRLDLPWQSADLLALRNLWNIVAGPSDTAPANTGSPLSSILVPAQPVSLTISIETLKLSPMSHVLGKFHVTDHLRLLFIAERLGSGNVVASLRVDEHKLSAELVNRRQGPHSGAVELKLADLMCWLTLRTSQDPQEPTKAAHVISALIELSKLSNTVSLAMLPGLLQLQSMVGEEVLRGLSATLAKRAGKKQARKRADSGRVVRPSTRMMIDVRTCIENVVIIGTAPDSAVVLRIGKSSLRMRQVNGTLPVFAVFPSMSISAGPPSSAWGEFGRTLAEDRDLNFVAAMSSGQKEAKLWSAIHSGISVSWNPGTLSSLSMCVGPTDVWVKEATLGMLERLRSSFASEYDRFKHQLARQMSTTQKEQARQAKELLLGTEQNAATFLSRGISCFLEFHELSAQLLLEETKQNPLNFRLANLSGALTTMPLALATAPKVAAYTLQGVLSLSDLSLGFGKSSTPAKIAFGSLSAHVLGKSTTTLNLAVKVESSGLLLTVSPRCLAVLTAAGAAIQRAQRATASKFSGVDAMGNSVPGTPLGEQSATAGPKSTQKSPQKISVSFELHAGPSWVHMILSENAGEAPQSAPAKPSNTLFGKPQTKDMRGLLEVPLPALSARLSMHRISDGSIEIAAVARVSELDIVLPATAATFLGNMLQEYDDTKLRLASAYEPSFHNSPRSVPQKSLVDEPELQLELNLVLEMAPGKVGVSCVPQDRLALIFETTANRIAFTHSKKQSGLAALAVHLGECGLRLEADDAEGPSPPFFQITEIHGQVSERSHTAQARREVAMSIFVGAIRADLQMEQLQDFDRLQQQWETPPRVPATLHRSFSLDSDWEHAGVKSKQAVVTRWSLVGTIRIDTVTALLNPGLGQSQCSLALKSVTLWAGQLDPAAPDARFAALVVRRTRVQVSVAVHTHLMRLDRLFVRMAQTPFQGHSQRRLLLRGGLYIQALYLDTEVGGSPLMLVQWQEISAKPREDSSRDGSSVALWCIVTSSGPASVQVFARMPADLPDSLTKVSRLLVERWRGALPVSSLVSEPGVSSASVKQSAKRGDQARNPITAPVGAIIVHLREVQIALFQSHFSEPDWVEVGAESVRLSLHQTVEQDDMLIRTLRTSSTRLRMTKLSDDSSAPPANFRERASKARAATIVLLEQAQVTMQSAQLRNGKKIFYKFTSDFSKTPIAVTANLGLIAFAAQLRSYLGQSTSSHHETAGASSGASSEREPSRTSNLRGPKPAPELVFFPQRCELDPTFLHNGRELRWDALLSVLGWLTWSRFERTDVPPLLHNAVTLPLEVLLRGLLSVAADLDPAPHIQRHK